MADFGHLKATMEDQRPAKKEKGSKKKKEVRGLFVLTCEKWGRGCGCVCYQIVQLFVLVQPDTPSMKPLRMCYLVSCLLTHVNAITFLLLSSRTLPFSSL